MNSKVALWTVTVAAVLLCLGVDTEAQLAKQGTYTAHFGWHSVGKTFEIEKDHTFFVGEFSGALFNDAGQGFLHQAAVSCPGVFDLSKGASNAHGYCICADQEGDKAFLVWKCKGSATRCEGDFQWTGGTGKYTGIKGDSTFTGFLLLPTSSGHSTWKGAWALP